MAEIITHAFVSAKSDSPDTTLVSASEWNDGHIFSGGINGQVLVYDNTQPNNIRWTDGAKRYGNTYIVTGSTPSPIVDVAQVNIVAASPSIMFALINIEAYTSTGAVNALVDCQVDNVSIGSLNIASGQLSAALTFIAQITAASHTVAITITAAANILTGIFYCNYFTFGN